MSLVRFSHTDDPLRDLSNKIRHTYDLHLMLQAEEIRQFFESPDFDSLLKRVAYDDMLSYCIKIEWLAIHPAHAMVFKDVDATWVHLKDIYTHQFQHLVFGKFPDEQEIHASLLLIKNRLDKVDWDIDLID